MPDGRLRGNFGSKLVVLGPSWLQVGGSEPSWLQIGGLENYCCSLLEVLESILAPNLGGVGHLGSKFGGCWDPCWLQVGGPWAHLGSKL